LVTSVMWPTYMMEERTFALTGADTSRLTSEVRRCGQWSRHPTDLSGAPDSRSPSPRSHQISAPIAGTASVRLSLHTRQSSAELTFLTPVLLHSASLCLRRSYPRFSPPSSPSFSLPPCPTRPFLCRPPPFSSPSVLPSLPPLLSRSDMHRRVAFERLVASERWMSDGERRDTPRDDLCPLRFFSSLLSSSASQ